MVPNGTARDRLQVKLIIINLLFVIARQLHASKADIVFFVGAFLCLSVRAKAMNNYQSEVDVT